MTPAERALLCAIARSVALLPRASCDVFTFMPLDRALAAVEREDARRPYSDRMPVAEVPNT